MSRQILNLNGDNWQLGQAPSTADPNRAEWDEIAQVEEWLPATVPGNVRADLIRAGQLPDPTYGMNSAAAQWVDDHCWWLISDFSGSPSPARRAHLVLRGIDYVSDLFLNGHHLGRHEGMFSPQIHALDRHATLLRAENRLAVRIVGSGWLPDNRSTAWEKALNHIEAKLSKMPGHFPHRRDTLKCQMGFGWDFAPPLRTMGIWDDVYAIVTEDVFIRDVVTRQQGTGDETRLTITIELDARQAGAEQLRCTLSGETFASDPLVVEQPIQTIPSTSWHTVQVTVPQPRLWWPWDHGRPDLYRLTVEVWDGDRLLDSISEMVGLRQVELKDWTLYINERRVYARGANWVPADILPGRVGEDDSRALLTLAREANMNMLRVWGGGLREKRAFYDLCDRLGILVWQEFPFACAFITRYPRSSDYLRLVAAEAQAIIRDLRNHPSIVLWCGGNEFSPRRNAPLVAALHRAVAQDPTRPFVPASPADGDNHNWQVWHNFQPATTYLDDTAAFASEFGLQAPPDAEALRRFIPPNELWPPGPSWSHHGAGLEKLWRYAKPFLTSQEVTLETFIQASQRAQTCGLQVAIEHYRRRKAQGCGGVLLWQFNEPWPAISWALVDFFRQPKLAYETVKGLFAPVLVSLDYPHKRYQPGDSFCADVWIVNDRAEALPGCRLEIALRDGAGRPVNRFTRKVHIAADSSRVVGSIDWTLPVDGGWRLTCHLTFEQQIVATNEYDLTIHDDIQPTVKQRLRTWLTRLLLPS
ncbi:MAG: glycoside hydrolase family 2 TIM barrel-domain containing protein [Anaerolineae bacterium]|jgi:beta-mannosidase